MNLYAIILILFSIAGVAVCIREWRTIQRNKKSDSWVKVEGVIVESTPYNPQRDLLPVIKYQFTLNDTNYTSALEFPPGTQAMPEFSKSYVKKYPEGKTVDVFYNPSDENQSTLEPGQQKDDWLIFFLGLFAALTGVGFLVFSNT